MEPLEFESVVRDWHKRVSLLQALHQHEAKRYRRRHVALGITAIVITGLSASAWPSSISDHEISKYIFSGLATLATIIVAAQTFLDYGGLSEKHRNTSSKSGAIRRSIDMLLISTPLSNEELISKASELNSLMAELSDFAPVLVVTEEEATKKERTLLFSIRKG